MPEKKEKIYVRNYRCRKCNAIISSIHNNSRSPYSSTIGVILRDEHECIPPYKHEIDKKEGIYADLISESEEPLSDAYEIYDFRSDKIVLVKRGEQRIEQNNE